MSTSIREGRLTNCFNSIIFSQIVFGMSLSLLGGFKTQRNCRKIHCKQLEKAFLNISNWSLIVSSLKRIFKVNFFYRGLSFLESQIFEKKIKSR